MKYWYVCNSGNTIPFEDTLDKTFEWGDRRRALISALGYSKTLEKPLGCSTKLEKSLSEAQPLEKSLKKSLGEAQPL